jgi:coproporphyrinogen III oxidase-like Fe-S oxidoreductase
MTGTGLSVAGRPLLVYVHIPFCSSKCHFCDWVTEVPTAELLLTAADTPRQRYLDALCEEISTRGAEVAAQGYRPSILYWGGGTASILSDAEIDQLASALHKVFDLSDLLEATIECSPETVTPEKLAAFRQAGFRRLSSGVQSFDDGRLRSLGRSHDAAGAERIVRQARAAGFDDINIDLICGFPGQPVAEVAAAAKQATELPLTHVALYPYRPAHGTVMRRQLARGGSARAGAAGSGGIDRDEQLGGYAAGAAVLVDAGLPEYAMSHFGTLRCHSDLAYFQLAMDWIGFGSGATSLLGGQYRAHRRGMLARYNSAPTSYDEEYPAASEAIAARLLYQSLTTFEGASRQLWEERLQEDFEQVVQLPQCRTMLDFIRSIAPVTADAEGIRIDSDAVTATFIQMQFLSAPEQARRPARQATAALLG